MHPAVKNFKDFLSIPLTVAIMAYIQFGKLNSRRKKFGNFENVWHKSAIIGYQTLRRLNILLTFENCKWAYWFHFIWICLRSSFADGVIQICNFLTHKPWLSRFAVGILELILNPIIFATHLFEGQSCYCYWATQAQRRVLQILY